MAVLRRLFFIVVFIVVIDDWFWFPFFIFSLSSVLNSISYNFLCITLCERKGSFLPRFRKLLRRQKRQIQTDSNHGRRREEQQRREKRDARKEERLLSPLIRSLLTSSSVLPQSVLLSINLFFLKENKKKKETKKNQFFNGRNQLKKRTIFYILGVFTSNRSFLHKSKRALHHNKKHYHEVFTNASNNKRIKHKYGNFNFKRRPRRVGFLVRVSYVFTFFICARFCWIFFLLFIQSRIRFKKSSSSSSSIIFIRLRLPF